MASRKEQCELCGNKHVLRHFVLGHKACIFCWRKSLRGEDTLSVLDRILTGETGVVETPANS